MPKFISLTEAAALVKSNQQLFIHGGAATPHSFLVALAQRKNELKNVKTIHIHLEGNLPIADEGCENSFLPNAIFVGADLRKSINEGHAQYIPVFLSEAPGLFRKNIWPLDFAFVQVSPPDVHGWCSLGVSVDIAKAAVETARKVIAIINPSMPRVHGDGLVHVSSFFKMVMNEEPIFEVLPEKSDDAEMAIGKNIASLMEDGATIQMGIGGIPNAALQFLHNFKNLGIHTEMFSDGILPLLESGVINNSKKRKHPGKTVSTFTMGSRKLYDFINDNPSILLLDAAYTNDTHIIRDNQKVTAINSAIEIDLSGQVCADSIGTRLYSGVGGQMDFIRGASLSEGGKPIIALKSQTSKGESKISATLKIGAGVVTTRAHVHYIVTEFGIAYLYGKNIAQRAKLLIEIAHPNHRARLEEEAFKLYGKCW